MQRLADDWGYRYTQLLENSIKSMPGSFPGIEESGFDVNADT